jgi:hypothetical protein
LEPWFCLLRFQNRANLAANRAGKSRQAKYESPGAGAAGQRHPCLSQESQRLPRCLESLRSQTLFPRSEIIVVDNAWADGSGALTRQITEGWPNVSMIQTGSNLGFSANNRGAEAARGKYLHLSTPDTWLENDCLEQFVLALERDQAEAAGGTILEYEDNTARPVLALEGLRCLCALEEARRNLQGHELRIRSWGLCPDAPDLGHHLNRQPKRKRLDRLGVNPQCISNRTCGGGERTVAL